MIRDARSLAPETTIDADIVIVGGGAAGISLAMSFADRPLKVVLLESGGLTYERQTQALYRGRNIGLRYEPLDLCRVRIFGGSTDWRGWAGWCKVFGENDFEGRDWVQLSGWPIKKRDLLPYYLRAQETMTLPADLEPRAAEEATSGSGLPLGDGDCVNDPIALSTAPHLGPRWVDAIKASSSVTVILHANVTQIETNETGRAATRIRFTTLEGQTSALKARAYIVAAGGIESARLMLLSNETVATGLGNSHGWVGRCFMDHPRYAWGQISSAPDPRHLLAYDPTHGVGQRRYGVPPPGARPLFGGGIATSDAAQQRERVLGSRTWIVPSSSLGERPGGRELREMVLWTLMRRRIPTDAALRVRKILFDVPGAAAAASAHIRSIIGMNRRWSFLTIVEPEPNRESRVLLDDVKDRFGQRRVKLDWRLTPLVERSLRFAQTAIVKDLRAVGVDCAVEGSSGPAGNQSIDEPRWVWHHMGTMRMSSDPTQGVVDANCKVHGMENLYVAGSSVFPTCSTDMPTLTLIALAHRLADHLSQKLADRPAEHESADRARRRIERHMAEARSPAGKTLAAFDFEGVPMVSKAQR